MFRVVGFQVQCAHPFRERTVTGVHFGKHDAATLALKNIQLWKAAETRPSSTQDHRVGANRALRKIGRSVLYFHSFCMRPPANKSLELDQRSSGASTRGKVIPDQTRKGSGLLPFIWPIRSAIFSVVWPPFKLPSCGGPRTAVNDGNSHQFAPRGSTKRATRDVAERRHYRLTPSARNGTRLRNRRGRQGGP